MQEAEIRQLQSAMNRFTKKYKRLGHARLIVDGTMGQLTKKRIRQIKYYLGYSRENMNTDVDQIFYHRMAHPSRVNTNWHQSKQAVANGRKRRLARRRAVLRNKLKSYLKPGVTRFDGKPVAKTAVPLLQWARKNGWRGVLVSGWRDPKYSQSLCYNMCGRPSCPGRCAGLASNHVGNSPGKFAMDVSDYYNFGQLMRRCPLKPDVHNALGARDPVHFSPSGN